MMRLYNPLQKEVQEEAQVGLNRLQNLQPPLFRAAGELHEARNELQQLLDFITNTFSFELSMELLDTDLNRFPESVLVKNPATAAIHYGLNIAHPKTEENTSIIQ